MRVPAARVRQKVTLLSIKNGPSGPIETETGTVRAGVDFSNRLVRSPGGNEVVSTATVILDPENTVKPESFMILCPGTPYARKAKVITVALKTPPREAAFVKAYCE